MRNESHQTKRVTNTNFETDIHAFKAHVNALLRKGSTRDQSKTMNHACELHSGLLEGYARKRNEGLERLLKTLTTFREKVEHPDSKPDPEDPGASACYDALRHTVSGDQQKVQSLLAAARFDDPTIEPSKKDVHNFHVKQQIDFEVIKGYDNSTKEKRRIFQSEGSRYTKVSNLQEYLQTKSEYRNVQVSSLFFDLSSDNLDHS